MSPNAELFIRRLDHAVRNWAQVHGLTSEDCEAIKRQAIMLTDETLMEKWAVADEADIREAARVRVVGYRRKRTMVN